MARRGSKRKVPVTLAGNGGARIERVTVPDPYQPGKTEVVNRVMNRNCIERIYSRDRLKNKGETQEDANARLLAANRLLRIWERAGGKGAGAIEYRIKVDVWTIYSGLSDSEARAFREIGKIKEFLGSANDRVLGAIVIDNIPFMTWVARDFRHDGHQARLEGYQMIRDALDRLVEYFGQAKGPDRGRIRSTGPDKTGLSSIVQ